MMMMLLKLLTAGDWGLRLMRITGMMMSLSVGRGEDEHGKKKPKEERKST